MVAPTGVLSDEGSSERHVLPPGWTILDLGEDGECYFQEELDLYQWSFPVTSPEKFLLVPPPAPPVLARVVQEQELARLSALAAAWKVFVSPDNGAKVWCHANSGSFSSTMPEDLACQLERCEELRGCLARRDGAPVTLRAKAAVAVMPLAKAPPPPPPPSLPLVPSGGRVPWKTSGQGNFPPLAFAKQGMLPWTPVPQVAAIVQGSLDLDQALLQSEDELNKAKQAWDELKKTVGSCGRSKVTLTFSTNVGSAAELHAVVKAMGVGVHQVATTSKGKRPVPPGARPPFGTTAGDRTQPAVQIVYQFSPKRESTIQLVNSRERRVTVCAARGVCEEHIDTWLTFFGAVVEVCSSAPPEEETFVPLPVSSPMNIRDALRARS